MKASDPPSSITHFLRCAPAEAATERPARSEPVNVTAATRSSPMIESIVEESTKRFVNTPTGNPARRNRSSRNDAVPGTLEACFKIPTLPAMIDGAANRTTCQRGKFHGMIASTGPRGS